MKKLRKVQRSKRARAEEKAMKWLTGKAKHMTSHVSGGRAKPRRYKYAKDKWDGREV